MALRCRVTTVTCYIVTARAIRHSGAVGVPWLCSDLWVGPGIGKSHKVTLNPRLTSPAASERGNLTTPARAKSMTKITPSVPEPLTHRWH
ncbi:hypothetical protein FKM82_022078 [Ascaphus truei]